MSKYGHVAYDNFFQVNIEKYRLFFLIEKIVSPKQNNLGFQGFTHMPEGKGTKSPVFGTRTNRLSSYQVEGAFQADCERQKLKEKNQSS